MNYLRVGALGATLLLSEVANGQNARLGERLSIAVQVLDGRNGTPVKNQRLLVFTGLSSDAVRTHARHTELITDEAGVGRLLVYPSETQWLQVFTDGRILCYENPNQRSFSIIEIASTGLSTPNNCGTAVRRPTHANLIIFTRPETLIEKMKR